MEAHRPLHRVRGDPPAAPPGDLVLRHRRQLRLRLLLVPLPRRHDRARGQGHRRACSPRPTTSDGRVGHRGRARAGRAVPPAPVQRPARHDGRRRGQRGRRAGHPAARRPVPDNPLRQRVHPRGHPAHAASPRPPGPPTASVGPHLADRPTRAAPTGSASRSPTCCGPRASRRCSPTRPSSIARRAAFATKHLWVTRYDPDERYPAGDLVNQHPGGAGLPAFAAADRVARRRGHRAVAHLRRHPRPPARGLAGDAGRQLRVHPAGRSGFFDRNPTLDVPR